MLDDCAAVDKLGTWGSGRYSGKRGEREEERQQQEGAHLYGSLIEEIGNTKSRHVLGRAAYVKRCSFLLMVFLRPAAVS
jgi:hypothetical protein